MQEAFWNEFKTKSKTILNSIVHRAIVATDTALRAALPPVGYACEVALRTIRWILGLATLGQG
jgi:hypothetical protein